MILHHNYQSTELRLALNYQMIKLDDSNEEEPASFSDPVDPDRTETRSR